MKNYKFLFVLYLPVVILLFSFDSLQNEPIDLVQGIWAESSNENAKFIIQSDTLRYFEYEDMPLHLVVDESDFIMECAYDTVVWHLIKLTQDSLIIYHEETEIELNLIKIK
jgi:hypothetical protein